MPESRSVFMPVEPQQFAGPFSGFLQPPAPVQTVAPPAGPPGPLGGVATIASAFLEGATKGRIKAYEQKENEKAAKLTALNNYMQNNVWGNDHLTDEAKQQASQLYSQALGGFIDEAAKGGESGKGAGKGKSGEKPQGDVRHHFTGIMKDLATGMTGGKTPKGGPDVGGTMVQIQNLLFEGKGLKPQFNKQGIITENEKAIETALKGLPEDATQEQALKAITPHLQAIGQHDPARAKLSLDLSLGRYQPAPRPPAPGSHEWLVWQAQQKPGQPGAPPPVAGQPTPAPVPGAPRSNELPDVGGIGNLELYGPKVEATLVSPDFKNAIPAVRNPRTGQWEDRNGIPLPEAVQKTYQQDKGFYRPQADKRLGMVIRDGRVMNEFQTEGGGVRYEEAYVRPDHWRERFQLTADLANQRMDQMEARDKKRSLEQVNRQHLTLKTSINRKWDGEIDKLDRDQTVTAADRARLKTEHEASRQQELKDLQADLDMARADLKAPDSPKDGGGKTPPPVDPPGGPAPKLSNDAKKILPWD